VNKALLSVKFQWKKSTSKSISKCNTLGTQKDTL